MKHIKMVKNWSKQKHKCCVCGTRKSVKYEVETIRGSNEFLAICNMCVINLLGTS